MRRLHNKTFLKQERVLVYWNWAEKYSYDPTELEIEPKRRPNESGKKIFNHIGSSRRFTLCGRSPQDNHTLISLPRIQNKLTP